MTDLTLHAEAVPMPAFCAGRFEVRGTLGEGVAGVVYRAFDHHIRREVALKLLRHASGRELYRCQREFRALAELTHPGLVALYELFADGGDWFFTMELVDGVSFHDHARPDGVLDPVRLRAALGGLVDAVFALHKVGRLHRDLKASHVRVTAAGRVVLLDFGRVASLGGAEAEPATDDPLAAASDWYGVGAILYEALVGAPPVAGEVPSTPALDGALAELGALAIALLAPTPRARPSGATILARLGATVSPTAREPSRTLPPSLFVGRERELGELRAALADARTGGVTMLVRGGAGIGKSALVRRFIRELGTRATVLAGRCFERAAVPFKMLDGVIDALTAALRALPPGAIGELAPHELAAALRMFVALRRVPAFADTSPAAIAPTADPHELQRRGFAALRALITGLARDRPVVVFIDDVHWGDADSAGFVGELVAQPARNVLVVLAHRPEDYLGVVARLRRRVAEIRELALAPLTADDARALVAQLGIDPEDAARLIASAAGHPLVLAEMARAMATPSPDPVPGTLEQLVARRAARLTPDARALLAVSSIAGRPLPLAICTSAAAVVGGHDDAAQLSAERLATVRRGDGDGDGDGELVLHPAHDLVRAAVLATLDVEARAGWHEALARAFEELHGPGPLDSQLVVEHWLAAGHPADAAAHAVPAAERAEAALAFRRAAELYGIALACGTWERADERELRCRQAYALACGGQLDEAAAAYGHAADLVADDDALDLERLRVEALLRRGRLDDALPAADRLLARLGIKLSVVDGASLTRLATQWVQAKLRGLDFTERAAADVPPAELRKIDTLYAISCGLAFEDPGRARVVQSELTRAALAAGEPLRVCLALAQEACFTAAAGHRAWPAAEAILARLAPLARRTDRVQIVGIAEVATGLAAFMTGQWPHARDQLEGGLATLRDHGAGVRSELDIGEACWLATLYYLGDWRALIRSTDQLLCEAIERGDVVAQVDLRTGRGAFAWLLRDRPGDARAQLAAAERALGDGFRLPHVHALIAAVHIELYAGDAAAAARRVAAAWPQLERTGALRFQQIRAELTMLRARVVLGDRSAPLDERVRTAHQAADELAAEGAPWTTAAASLIRASAAAFAGDLVVAHGALVRAEGELAASAMAGWGEVARLRRGMIDGGREGAARAVMARDELRDRGAANPDAIAAVLLPWP